VDAGIPNPAGTIVAGVRGVNADLDATLQMLERDDKAEIISNPRITTADNKEAKILVGKKIPLVISDEAGNAVTELTTIGVKLTVVPHINQDDRITLDLAPEVSDLSSQATVQGGIVIVTSEASTRVIVGDGETAVIGGLIRTNESTVESGVPWLKDIPLVGDLFKSTNVVSEERELLIFVTPRIIRTDDA
jgi:type II secretory pathway component GspD/PulD (secretin)